MGKWASNNLLFFLDIIPANNQSNLPILNILPDRDQLEQYLISTALNDYLRHVQQERLNDTKTIEKHLELSLNELIKKQNEN